MAVRGIWLAACLLLSGVAQAGSAPAELNCVSESGKVKLEGAIPSPSSEEMQLKLSYTDGSLTFDSNANQGFVVADFARSVFTLVVVTQDQPLTLYAIPSSMTVKRQDNGDAPVQRIGRAGQYPVEGHLELHVSILVVRLARGESHPVRPLFSDNLKSEKRGIFNA